MNDVTVVFEQDNQIDIKVKIEKAHENDRVNFKVNGELKTKIESDQVVTVTKGDKIDLIPLPGNNSWFSHFVGINPPVSVYSSFSVKVVFRG